MVNHIPSLEELYKTHHVARNTLDVFEALETNPNKIYVRSLNGSNLIKITDIVVGPFKFHSPKGNLSERIEGIDLVNENTKSFLRIVTKFEQPGVVEILNKHSPDWIFPDMCSIRIYIPND